MRKMTSLLKDEEGQSTIEFVLSSILSMGLVFFYVKLVLLFAYGNFVQYATFMSARALLSAGVSQEDQLNHAKNVLIRMVKKSESQPEQDRFDFIAKGVTVGEGDAALPGAYIGPGELARQGGAGDPFSSWQIGVRYAFQARIFSSALIRWMGATESGGKVTLQSESWLGREASYNECKQQVESKKGLFDNGC